VLATICPTCAYLEHHEGFSGIIDRLLKVVEPFSALRDAAQ